MRGNTAGKLAGAWCAVMLPAPLAFLLLRGDFAPGHGGHVFITLLAALAAVGAAGLAITYVISRRWEERLKQLQMFVSALPESSMALAGDGPDELQTLE